MGFNTSIIFLNDACHNIKRDPEFPEKLYNAILEVGYSGPVTIPVGSHVNALTVVESHHADQTVIIAVGGNYATVLYRTCRSRHHQEEDKLKIVKEMAEDLGYRLIKKHAKRKNG